MGQGPVALAADHGGFELKQSLKAHLSSRGYRVLDLGTHSKGAVDYPVFARRAAEAVARADAWRAVVIDGAGIGSCMVANKVPGVRAAMAFDVKTANNAREHNNANVLTLGAGTLSPADAEAIVDVFLTTACTVQRHLRRASMIDALDEGRNLSRAGASPRSQGMSSDYEQLVQQITAVLSKNPGMLASLGSHVHGGAPGFVCTTCNTCDGNCCSQAPDALRALQKQSPGSRFSAKLGVRAVPKDVAKLIDHTLLKAEATYDQIDELCDEAREFGFASVCINPIHVKRAALRLRGAEAKVCTVIGFPLGATPREVKALEARRALRDGARELDMVLNIGALKSGDHDTAYEDIRLLREVAHEGGAILKVIIETALLTDAEKVIACQLAKKARADFVKTSTGFSKSGATAHDVALMARAVDHELGVKASGGVKSAADAEKMVLAGATRIGASVGVRIAKEARGEAVSGPAGAGY